MLADEYASSSEDEEPQTSVGEELSAVTVRVDASLPSNESESVVESSLPSTSPGPLPKSGPPAPIVTEADLRSAEARMREVLATLDFDSFDDYLEHESSKVTIRDVENMIRNAENTISPKKHA